MVEGECKWAVAGFRTGLIIGYHPKDPAQRASDEPTAGLPGTQEGTELGADVEEKALQDAIEKSKKESQITS